MKPIKHPIARYLVACYAYEVLASPIISDAEFDSLGMDISLNWDGLVHPHKHLVDPESCMYTSGITKPYHEWPMIILNVAHEITGVEKGDVWGKALKHSDPNNIDDLF